MSFASDTVLQNLLAEEVSIRDIRTIVETLSEESGKTQDPEQLTSLIRPKLGRMIVQNLVETQESLPVMTLEPQLEQLLHNAIQQGNQQGPMLEPGLAENLFKAMKDAVREVEEQNNPAVLVVSPAIRPWLAKMIKNRVTDLTVLSYSEIPDDQAVEVVYTVKVESKEK